MYQTSLSQKGQIVLPKPVRDALKLEPSDTFQVKIHNGSIVLSPTPQLDDVFGMFTPTKKLTKKNAKMAIKSGIVKKFQTQ